MITAEELFDRCREIVCSHIDGESYINKRVHETLKLACTEGTRNSGMAFGNLFSQVSYLCKINSIEPRDKAAIHRMRRNSNSDTPLSNEQLAEDISALALFISKVFNTTAPTELYIPGRTTERCLKKTAAKTQIKYIRAIVNSWDENYVYATSDDESDLLIDYYNKDKFADNSYIIDILREGMQINLLDCDVANGGIICPLLIVVEPDFLLDISSLAACFTDYGCHPLSYTIGRMRQRPNSQAILLGNFAGSALDDIINDPDFRLSNTINKSFREQALQFCTCNDFHAKAFLDDAARQADNIKEAVNVLFDKKTTDKKSQRDKVLLEPSFVCEQLGLQGRIDLMTHDFRLIVEQKSGKNMYIERNTSAKHGRYREDHYCQLILYYGVLNYNFGTGTKPDSYLLYSKYPADKGLMVSGFATTTFLEIMKVRNRIVAQEYLFAHDGFDKHIGQINTETLNEKGLSGFFYEKYLKPQIDDITVPLHSLPEIEHNYFCRMMTFIYREQLASKVGGPDGQAVAASDLWNMPLHEKLETGNIFLHLTVIDRHSDGNGSGYNIITLAVSEQGADFLPNFRRGDMVYVYKYDREPDVRKNILYKGTLEEISSSRLVVRLNERQQNDSIFNTGNCHTYAIEHTHSDVATSSAIRGLHELITAPKERKNILLGQRQPEADTNRTLTRNYHPNYDDILLRIKQANDYFMLIGPPGTGKTSMALQYMVKEELATDNTANILITSYTNRAVDEICSMLCDCGLDFIRIGNEASCDPRFAGYMLESTFGSNPKLNDIKQRLENVRIIVGTTSTLQARPFIFEMKSFSIAIIDEASQILEPNIIGLLAKHRTDGKTCIGKFVLIGDYKQLPAVVQQNEKMTAVSEQNLIDICLADCRLSLFERLIRWERKQGRKQFIGTLRHQGRMHPAIAQFPNEMFYKEERLEPVPCPHQLDTSLNYNLPPLDAIDAMLQQERMIFIPSENCIDGKTSEKANASEAIIVADLLRRIYRFYANEFDADRTVGVIVPYRNQIAMIRHEIEKLAIPVLENISIDTVERYQGSQRDVIIYSFTIQRPSQLIFLTANCFEENGRVIDRKLNVAITRAKKQMIMTGNTDVLNRNSIFAEIIRRYSTDLYNRNNS